MEPSHLSGGFHMLYSAFMLMMSSAFLMLRLSPSGSFPKPLSAKEEQEALLAWKNGDATARDRLIEHNLRLVAHITKKYYAQCDDTDDLISIGTIGLIKAISTYDPDNEILMYLRSMRRRATEVSLTDAMEADEEGSGLSLMDVLSEDSDLDDNLILQEQAKSLRNAMESELDDRECKVIRLRYGMDGHPPLTQRETAAKLGISRSYISRIEKKALGKLRLKMDS